eukprot:TRINITY_DN3056_c0_g1_i1.p1 TRINITY_DN3056_c0_g1~~TRINITY_DN3056_c0_g1_i1.p1  ORF type:complete len:748 (-),score=153.39 TRINITY_DN3056_c0_g1_i1:1020-3161(-)
MSTPTRGTDDSTNTREFESARRAMEKQIQHKDSALVKLTSELGETRDKLSASEAEARSRHAEVKRLQDENARLQGRLNKSDTPSKSRAKMAESEGSKFSFEQMTDLENALRNKDREIKELTNENKVLERQIKQREKELTKQSLSRDSHVEKVGQLPLLQAEIKMLTKQLEQAQEETRTMTQLEQAKTAVIEKLTLELQERASGTDRSVELSNKIQSLEKQARDREDELHTMEKVLQQKESALRSLTEGDLSRDERAQWIDERRFLQGQARKQAEARAACEKTIKSQEARIAQLSARIDLFAKTLRDTHSRDGELETSFISKASEVSRRQEGGSAVAEGEVDVVPAEMYEALERAVQSLQTGIKERDAFLADKDDTVLALKRRTDVLKHALTSLERKYELDTESLNKQVRDLQEELDSLDEKLKISEREAEIAKHSRASSLKTAKRHENELYGELCDLRISVQKHQQEQSAQQRSFEEETAKLTQRLGGENARLKTQLEEVLALHDDIRAAAPDAARRTKVYVVVHSPTSNVRQLADAFTEGSRSVPGVDVVMWRVARLEGDTRDDAAESDLPLATPDILADADALVLGCPGLSGGMAAELRAFLDQTGRLWATGALVGKIGAAFIVTSIQHSGQEAALESIHRTLLHHGMVVVGAPYTDPRLSQVDEVAGGSPYGAGSIQGDGSRQPSETELGTAKQQGMHVAEMARRMVRGK